MEAKKQGSGEEELSMEEILQSIRRIIADDSADDKSAAPAVANMAKSDGADINPVATSEILELTDMIEEDGSITNLKPVAKTTDSIDVLDNIDAALTKPVEVKVEAKEIKPEIVPSPPQEKSETVPSNDGTSLLSKEAEDAAISSLSKLKSEDRVVTAKTTPSPVFRSGSTIEDLVEDLLKPMMKEWLDNNLPAIVERIVEREIIRLTRR